MGKVIYTATLEISRGKMGMSLFSMGTFMKEGH